MLVFCICRGILGGEEEKMLKLTRIGVDRNNVYKEIAAHVAGQ